MQFIDLELVRRLEAAEAQAARECAQFLARKKPESGAISIDIMGGMATFTGIGSPVTQAVALALHGPVSDKEIDELENFYRARGSEVNIEVARWPAVLSTSNSDIAATVSSNFPMSSIARSRPTRNPPLFPPASKSAAPRQQKPASGPKLSRAVSPTFPVTEELIEIMEMFSQRPSDRAYLAYADGKITGSAASARPKKSPAASAPARFPIFAAAASRQLC